MNPQERLVVLIDLCVYNYRKKVTLSNGILSANRRWFG